MNIKFHILINSIEQFNILFNYLDIIDRVYLESSIVGQISAKNIDILKENNIGIYIVSPRILRKKNYVDFENLLRKYKFDGCLVENLESLSFISELYENKFKIILDSCMYILNSEALLAYCDLYDNICEFYNSYELNKKECNVLKKAIDFNKSVIQSNVVYGRIPMMVSANCVRKTMLSCTQNDGFVNLKDRYQKEFPVLCNCTYCYNVIYNSVPLSLHKSITELYKNGNIRIDLTNENEFDSKKLLDYFKNLDFENNDPDYEYTTGHFKRGVE